MTRSERTALVKGLVEQAGFERVGVAPAGQIQRADYVRDWLARGLAGEMTYLQRHLEQRLDPRRFTRIHRSTVVAIDRIGRLEPQTHGEHVAILLDGTRLRVSRTYRANLEARLGQTL